MKYIFIGLIAILSFGCEDKIETKVVSNSSTVSDTSSLQPAVDDASLQPPTPPSLH